MSDHERLRAMTAAYVLGGLDADERRELESHIGGCETCRQEVVAFAPIPGLLSRVDPSDLVDVPAVDDRGATVVAAVRADVARLARSRRRWRVVAVAAVAIAALVSGATLLGDQGSDERRDAGVVLAVASAPPGAEARIVADERAWGTYVYVSADQLPERPVYTLWVVDADGHWERAGTWSPTPQGPASLGGSTQLALADIDRVVITGEDRSDEIVTTG